MNEPPCTLLVDNGSHRATSTLNLRRMASALSERVGAEIHPVSLLHSTRVDPADLDGDPAQILEPFLKARREEGIHSFLMVPLFFGHSAAIYEYVPQRMRQLREGWPELEMRIAPPMVDLGDTENTDVAEIIAAIVREKIAADKLSRPAVTLVDHGTPRIAVNKVRNFVADQLDTLLNDEFGAVVASSMERREGGEYDFNEPLLENLLGSPGFEREVVIAMLFISPGRHAGPEGDIAEICKSAEEMYPGLKTFMSDLFASHPRSLDLLGKRYRQGLESEPVIDDILPSF